jgi:bifunctional DNA-binding transcriptional regulator/antitoxin component of YhaV-PrlF toxin-antitoxin module
MDYKKYSLGKLEEWVHDTLSCAEATPQEIYDVIKKVVEENYYIYKDHASRCYELLALLNGNGIGHIKAYDDYVKVCDKDDPSPECKGAWNDFWEEHYYPEEVKDNGMRPWGHSDMEYLLANPTLTEDRISNFPGEQYTEKELNAMCDAAEKKDKVVKWQLPVEIDGLSGECYVNLPDDLLEAANIKENDLVEWFDNGDGSYILKKCKKGLQIHQGKKGLPIHQDLMKDGYKTYEEAVKDGWTMTADGFWIKESN